MRGRAPSIADAILGVAVNVNAQDSAITQADPVGGSDEDMLLPDVDEDTGSDTETDSDG